MTSTGVNVGFTYGEKSSSKVLKPPGGECSDIFGTSNASFQQGRSQGKQYQHTSIFGTDGAATVNNQSPTARRDSDTQNRLFGTTASEESSPRRIVDRMKSNVFTGEEQANTNHSAKKQVRRNPITGEVLDDDDEETEENGLQNENGNANPITGDGTVASPNQATCVKIRNPPGGKSSGIF
uniref:Microtubule-associated protein Jupiter n=1 Tax=Hadrurus spadix TaxID=141984 RepID=A0A1W7RAD2_9SCOR